MGKGEIARYEQFLLFPQCFQKACFPGASKGVIVWEWVKIHLLLFLARSKTISFLSSFSFGPFSSLRNKNRSCILQIFGLDSYWYVQITRNRKCISLYGRLNLITPTTTQLSFLVVIEDIPAVSIPYTLYKDKLSVISDMKFRVIHLFPKQQIFDSSKLKEFADDNFKFDENG